MDASIRTSAALIDRANGNIAQLLRRFENIIALAPDQGNRTTTAVEAYQMEVETAALIRAAEDITSLTRLLKEMWLFGQLDTIGPTEAERKTEEEARLVAARMEELGRRGGGVAEGAKPEAESASAEVGKEALEA